MHTGKPADLTQVADATNFYDFICRPMKVKSMQRPGTEANRTQIQPSKPKREITIIVIL